MLGFVRKLFNDIAGLIVLFPLIIFMIWGLNFCVKHFLDVELSRFQNIGAAFVASAAILFFFTQRLGSSAVIASVFGYLVVVLVIGIFG